MYNSNTFGLPRQKLTYAQKNKAWQEDCVDAIVGMAGTQVTHNGRTSKFEKQVNYDLINSIIEQSDFEYILDPYGFGKSLGPEYGMAGTKMEVYNVIRSKVELLKGEEMNRPFNWYVRGVAGEVTTIKERKKRELLAKNLTNLVMQELGIKSEEEAMSLQQIKQYMEYEFMDTREVSATQLLKYLFRRNNLSMKFSQGWEHALISAEEIYYTGAVAGHADIRVVNPINFDYDRDSDAKFIQDSTWVREERWLSNSTILDLWGDELSEDDIKRLDDGTYYNPMRPGDQLPGMLSEWSEGQNRNFINQPDKGVYVATVCWRSMEKIGFLNYFDEETQQWLTSRVDDDYKLIKEQKKAGWTIDWEWRTQIWEGTRIADNIYVGVRPCLFQTGKLPYNGYVYNNVNSRATSIVDLIKPHQYTYMVIWHKMMQEVAKAKGKKMIMDVAQIPKSKGMSMKQWIYYFDRLDIAWINSMEENAQKQKPSFNQFTDIDVAFSANMIQNCIALLDKIEQQISVITGVSPQREAQTSASETATGTNTAMVQSSHITEPLFRYHNEVKKQVLTSLLEISKTIYADGLKLAFVVDESYVQNLEIDGNEFPDSDYGLFVTDSSKEHMTKQKLEQLAQIALQQDKVFLSDIVKMYNTDSISEFQTHIVRAEKERIAQAQQQEQAQMESNERMNQQKIEWEKEKADREDARNTEDNDTKRYVVDRQVEARDNNGDGRPDTSGVDSAVQQAKIAGDHALKARELEQKSRKDGDDTYIKQGELGVKREANDIKREEIAKKAAIERSKMKHEQEMVDKEERMMDKEDKLKDKDVQRTMKLDSHKLNVESKKGDIKVKNEEKSFKVKEKHANLGFKINKDKVATAKAMPKKDSKPKKKD